MAGDYVCIHYANFKDTKIAIIEIDEAQYLEFLKRLRHQ